MSKETIIESKTATKRDRSFAMKDKDMFVTFDGEKLRCLFKEKNIQLTVLSKELGMNYTYLTTACKDGRMRKVAFLGMSAITGITLEEIQPDEVVETSASVDLSNVTKALDLIIRKIELVESHTKSIENRMDDLEKKLDEHIDEMKDIPVWAESVAEDLDKLRVKEGFNNARWRQIKEMLEELGCTTTVPTPDLSDVKKEIEKSKKVS